MANNPGGFEPPRPLPPQPPLPPELQQAWAPPPPPIDPAGADRYRVPWSALDVFAIIGLVIVFGLVFFLAFGAVLTAITYAVTGETLDSNSFKDSAAINGLFWFLQWTVTLGVAVTYFKIRGYRLSLKVFGFRGTGPFLKTLAAIGLTILVVFLSFVAENLYSLIQSPEQQPVTEMFGSSALSFVITIIIVALLTPVVEEMFFRGIIHQGLEQRLGFFPGALISATIFALAHLDLSVFVPIFLLGFGFAFLMHQTRSLWPSITGHFIFNAVAVVAEFYLVNSGS